MAAAAAAAQPPSSTYPTSVRWALASLSLGMLLPSLGISIANVGLPTLASAFGASFQQAQWVVLAYLLALTSLVVGAGRLGDIVGRKRLLLGGIALFTVASACSGLAPTLGLLLAARAAQGLGAAIMMALTLAFVGETVPKARTGSAMGLLGTMSAVGTALGPSLGGMLIASLGWQALFLIKLPLGLLALMLAWRHLPADKPKAADTRSGFDPLGTLLLAATLASYALAMTLGRGHFGATNIALLLASALGAGIFILAEARVASPLIKLAMFRDKHLSASLLMSMLVSTVVMATLVVGPFYLSGALKLNAAMVGLVLSAGPIVSALTGVPAGRLVDLIGVRRMMMAGSIAMLIGCMALATMPMSYGIAGYVACIIIATTGYALFQAANNTAVMADVPADRRGLVSGLLSLSRNLGLITGASLMGAVFALSSGADEIASAQPDAVAAGMHGTFAIATLMTVIVLALAIANRRLGNEDSSQ